MKKTYKMDNLDCANCAAKMEKSIQKIKGVSDATVSFFAQKLMIETDDDLHDEIMQEVCKAVKKVESGCSVIL